LSSGLVGIAFLSLGCGSQPYPPQLTYPLRSDWLVAKLPAAAPSGPHAAGKLDEFIAGTSDRGGKAYNPADLTSAQRDTLEQSLSKIFGTPAAPMVLVEDDAKPLADQLQLRPDHLAEGSKLYKQFCLQCHGLTGDGRGPTGQWVFPIPRDFRQGVFKFVSSTGSGPRKATREDLDYLLRIGVDRTSMPAFPNLNDTQREQIIAYVIHLSLRGEVEYKVMLELLSEGEDTAEGIEEAVQARLRSALTQWVAADNDVIPVKLPDLEADSERMSAQHGDSVRRGFELFRSQGLGCQSCHEDYGRQTKYLYDSWGGTVRVTDLTEGVFRGGKLPQDIYYRLKGGIGPSQMPAVTTLSEEQMWDLVNFVRSMPSQRMLPVDVRKQIYPHAR
jgi:mono/diheme cytochrome c family protein